MVSSQFAKILFAKSKIETIREIFGPRKFVAIRYTRLMKTTKKQEYY